MVNIYYRYRRLMIIGLVLLILVFIGLTALKLLRPGYEDMDTVISSGKGYTDIEYEVVLKPNDVYNEETVTNQDYYLSPFTKYIKINASAGLSAPDADIVSCTSGGKIYLMSKIDQGGVLETIWSKEYKFMSYEEETSDTGSVDVDRTYSVYLDNYNNLIDDLAENHGLYTIYELHIVFDGEMTIEKNGKVHTEPFRSTAIMSLNNVVYQININEDDNIDVAVKETHQVSKDIDWYPILVFIGMALIFGSLLAYVLMKTISVHEVDMYHNKVQRIMREYHSRLAALSKSLTYQASVMISIENFEDLIKIADEIGQMVFYYEIDEAEERKIEFYVFDDARIYYLVMFG